MLFGYQEHRFIFTHRHTHTRRSDTHKLTHRDTRRSGDDRTLTASGFGRAIRANVDSPSHTHVVLESRDTDLQPRADQEPSRDALRAHKHTHVRYTEINPPSTHTHPGSHTLTDHCMSDSSLIYIYLPL